MNSLYKIYEDYKSRNETYLRDAYQDISYYLGNHYTAEELKVLRQRKQSPSVVNYAYSMIYTQMSIMGANAVEFRAIARDDNDVKKTKLINDVLAYISYISDGDMQARDAMETMLVSGRGNMGVYYDPYADDGRGEVKYEAIPLQEVYYDPRAKDRLGRDCEYIFRRKRMTLDQAKALWPQYTQVIMTHAAPRTDFGSVTNPNPSINGTKWGADQAELTQDQTIEVIEAYQKKFTMLVQLLQGDQVLAEVPEDQLMEAQRALAVQGAQITTMRNTRKDWIELTLMFGQAEADRFELPLSDYPIVPMVNMWSGNLFPFGDIRQIRPLNDETNKMRSLRIQHMATSVNGRLIARKGIFEKEGSMEANLSRPGAVMYANTMSDDIAKDLMFLQSGPVSADNYNHEAITKEDMQAVSGVYEMMQGGSAGAPETFRATLAMDEYGQRKLRYKLKNVEACLGQLGKVALEWAQQAYGQDKVIRIVQPQWNSEEEQVRYQKMNVPIFDDYGQIAGYFNDLSVGKFDVIVKGGSTMPSNRWAEMQAYREDLQLGIIDDIEYIKKTDIYDRQGLLERKSVYSQQMQQLQQLQQMVEQLEGEAAKLDDAYQNERKDKEVQKVRFMELIRLLKAEMQNVNNVDKAANRIERTVAQSELKMKELEAQKKQELAKAKAKTTTKPK